MNEPRQNWVVSHRFNRRYGDEPTTVPAWMLEPRTPEQIERDQKFAEQVRDYLLGYSDKMPNGRNVC